MFRHPHYLEIPWEMHWDRKEGRMNHHVLLTLFLILLALFLVGVGVTSGLT